MPHVVPVDPAKEKLTVTYAGSGPVFKPIAGTPLQYAANTQVDVIKIDDSHYFACNSGVWFTAGSASGPWTPATYVPAVVYTIPPSSPMYHVTFVHVYDANGVALTAPRPTPAPQPGATYENIAPSQLSQGDVASYYHSASAGYLGAYAPYYGGYVVGTGYYNPGYIGANVYVLNPPTYGNFNDTTYAREQNQSTAPPRRQASADVAMPAHGPRSVPGPNTNVYAADDGVYRVMQSGWQKDTGGGNWVAATTVADSLARDRRARLAGYEGVVEPV